MARPSKLNEELIDKFTEKLKKGLPVTSVCDLLMVTQPSYNNWLRQGEQDLNDEQETLFSSFFLMVKKSRAEFEEEALEDIGSGRPGWQGKAWVLERTNQKYMPKQEIVAEEGKVQVILGSGGANKIKEVKRNDV